MRLSLALFLACTFAFPAPAQSPPMRPAISVKSRAVEIQIEIDQRIRADGRLFGSILVEAKRVAAAWQQDAEKSWREDRTMFGNGPWTFERGYYFEAAVGPYISVSVLNYSYTGGAHPNQRTTTMLWHRDQARRTTIREIFREARAGGPTLTRLAELIGEDIAKEKRERGAPVSDPIEQDEWISAVKADLETMGAPSLVPSTISGTAAGIDFHFSAYDVGPYAEGAYGAYLPWQALAPFLTDRTRELFGGERADQDPKRQ